MPIAECILHLSGEYPDSLNKGRNSPVVARLVKALSEHVQQVVVSINRCTDPRRAAVVEDSPQHLAVRYFALPYGLAHHFFLHRLAATIGTWLRRRDIRPSLIIGHKFTIEGVLARRLAREFDCDYALGFMNTTDEKLWRALPWCRGSFERIAAGARAWIFPTPMTERRFLQRLGAKPHQARVIPYISGIPEQPPTMRLDVDSRALLTVFNFQMLRHKNFARLVRALMGLRAVG